MDYSPKSTNPKKSKKTFLEIAGTVAAIVVAVFIIQSVWVNKQKPSSNKPTGEQAPTTLKVQKTEVPTSQLPQQFPSDIPIESGAKIVQNYNASAEDGRFQATRVFETKKTLSANYTLYKDFFSKNGWTVLTTLDQPTLKVVSAKKNNANAQVTINENSVTKIKTVDISVTITP